MRRIWMNVTLGLASMVGSVLIRLGPLSASVTPGTLDQDVREISMSAWPTPALLRELLTVFSCSTTTSATVNMAGGEDTARKERTSVPPGPVRMEGSVQLLKLDSFANVLKDFLDLNAAIMVTVDVPSTLAIMEVPV